MIRRTDPLGDSTSYVYDAAGQLVATTDPRGDTTHYGYDADGNQTSVTAADGSVTRYAYDSAGNVISRTDANGHVTRWSYDGDGEKASMTNPIGARWTYEYDPAGDLVGTVTASGGTISQSYDVLNRVTRVSYSDGTPSVSYAYDLDGNRIQMQDGGGTETYSYDLNNQLTGATQGSNSFSYAYNPAGELTRRVYPGGFATQLGYDADGNLVSASSPAGPTQYGYDAAGNVVSTTLANGIAEQRAYDAAGRLTAIDATRDNRPFSSRDYRLDANGNPTTVTATAPHPSDGPPSLDHGTHAGWTETYSYDNRDRLVQACLDAPCQKHEDPAYAYSYDPVGNMLVQETPKGTTRYSFNAADELTSSRGPGPDLSYSYDPNGNQTRAGSTRYRYDLANHLVSAAGPGVSATYTYDGDGNLLTRRAPGDDAQYHWDTNAALPQLAVEQNDYGNTPHTYGYGVGLTPVTLTSSGRNYMYLTDKLGSVTELANANGEPVASYRYDPFGALLDPDVQHQLNAILFTGQYLDPATGLYNLRARTYDATQTRFLQTDPLAAEPTDPYVAAYVYAGNDPTLRIDPAGMKSVSTATSPDTSPCVPSRTVRCTASTQGEIATSKPVGYVNPFKRSWSLFPEQIDQGVDYAGTGPILAIGHAFVIGDGGVTSGWYGHYLLYKLTSGEHAGRYIYVAEGIAPRVRGGASVNAGDVIAYFVPGAPHGIETGWGSSTLNLSYANSTTGYTRGHPTPAGLAFARFLISLGARVRDNPGPGPTFP
jgi:RHS repeat-associated protein